MLILNKMKLFMFVAAVAIALVESAREDDPADAMKKRMKLIGGIQSYERQNNGGGPKTDSVAGTDEVKYTEPIINATYKSDTNFNPLGMGHLYYVTRKFMDFIEGDNLYPDIDIPINYTVDDVLQKGPEWLELYHKIFAVLAVGVLFVLVEPVVALLFCCCRCGGRCGAQKKQEKHRDPCKRMMIATALTGVSVIILFGVVCAFVTNEHFTDGTGSLASNTKTALDDISSYISNTNEEIECLLEKNFKELKMKLQSSASNAGDIVKNQLASASRAVALSNLTAIVNGMEIVKQDLAGIREVTLRLQSSASTLNDDLDVLRNELIAQLRKCINEPACRHLLQQHHITELRVAQNFSELPDITQTFTTISNLLGENVFDSIQRKVLEGQKNFDNLKYQITRSVQENMPQIDQKLDDIGKKLRECKNTFQHALKEAQRSLDNVNQHYVTEIDYYNKEYSQEGYYVGLGISGALLLILLCLTLGLLCGICGKRPEEMYSEDSDCCNTIAGGRFLMLAVWLAFLLSGFLMLIITVLFLVGVTIDLGVCKPLNNPRTNKMFNLLDKAVNFEFIYGKSDVNITLSGIIESCQKNETLYEALKLEVLYNIDDIREEIKRSYLEDQLKSFKSRINVRTDNVVLLDPDAKVKLLNLARSPLSGIQFEKYAELLNLQVTKTNLTQLSNELLLNADKLPAYTSGNYDLSDIKKSLRTKARYLRILQNSIVTEIQNEINILRSNVSNLKEHLKFNHTSLNDAIVTLLNEIEEAQLYLKKHGSTEMKLLIDQHLEELQKHVNGYVDRVINKTKKEVGKCGPVGKAYDSYKVATCNRLMDPFNGFWASVGWSVLFFIPAIILSVKLSALYTKSEAYAPPGMCGENEYLYDAYADRDNMPLAMAQRTGKKKSRHRNYRQESFDNSNNGSYLQDYSVHLGRTDRTSNAETDVRYNDMAPKHWGDVNSRGGESAPWTYHHPSSTEYERPPPYYFPGTGKFWPTPSGDENTLKEHKPARPIQPRTYPMDMDDDVGQFEGIGRKLRHK